MVVERVSHNKALLSDKFSAALQICRRAQRYMHKSNVAHFETVIIF